MKKLVAFITMGTIFASAAGMSVSAEEYTVKKGDNLWDIAENYNTTMADLVDINKLDSTIIQPEQTLIITEEDGLYVVEKGDTLSGIGTDFDVSVKQIKKWNDLKSDLILIGQELTIKGASPVQTDESVAVKESKKPEKKVEEAKEEAPKQEASESKPNKQEASESKPNKQASESKPKKQASKSEQEPAGKTISVSATAYTAKCDGCSGITSTGIDLNKDPNAKVIAVDPNVIPLGSRVHVEGYGTAIAGDIGGAIKGNKIDIHVPTKDEAYSWGVRTVNVTIVE